MISRIALAAVAALSLTSIASAAGVDFADSQRDNRLQAQAFSVAPSAGGIVTTPAIDPAYSQRDLRLQAQADAGNGAVITTHGDGYANGPVDTGFDFALGSNR